MSTVTFANTRFQFVLPTSVKVLLQRAWAPADPAVHVLDKGATTWVVRPLGCTVSCETGTLWLTFDNDAGDVILEAGQSHRCTQAAKLSIHALAAARLSVA